MRLAVVLALFAVPASAQDIEFSPIHTEACLQEAVGPGEVQNCPGSSAQQCMIDTHGGETTVGMRACLDAELTYWDARLNTTYQQAMSQAKDIDAEMAELESAAPPIADALLAMQRAWIPYRDAACTYERVQWGGGTGGGPATLACLLELTANQTMLIKDRMQ